MLSSLFFICKVLNYYFCLFVCFLEYSDVSDLSCHGLLEPWLRRDRFSPGDKKMLQRRELKEDECGFQLDQCGFYSK